MRCKCWNYWYRQNQDMESAFQQEKGRLEKEAQALAEQLQAVLSDKFSPQTDFDADTPIDKTLKMLQTVIGVSLPALPRLGAVQSQSQLVGFLVGS